MPIGQKLLNLREYHRPAAVGGDLQDALGLLARPDIHTAPLAGGDALVGSGNRSVEAVVDLQGLDLDLLELTTHPHAVRIGAMATRSALVDWPRQLTGSDGLSPDEQSLLTILATAARRWGGNVQRNRATAGGAVVLAASNDALVAALLVAGATVTLQAASGAATLPLVDFLPQRNALLSVPMVVTEITVPVMTGTYALETVARTPSNAPIVLAAAYVGAAETHLVLGGVAPQPLLVTLDRPLTAESIPGVVRSVVEGLSPRGDVRGSAEYRRAMAAVLAERALSDAWGRESRQGVR